MDETSGAYSQFADLLTEAIYRIKATESQKSIRQIETDLGVAIGKTGRASIEDWRKGNRLPKPPDVEKLAYEIVNKTSLKREWLEKFLRSAHYPDSPTLCAQLFPPSVKPSEQADEAESPVLPSEDVQFLGEYPRAEPEMLAPVDLESDQPPVQIDAMREVQKPFSLPSSHLGPRQRRWYGLVLVALGVILVSVIYWRRDTVTPQSGELIIDGSFERGSDLSHWRNVGGCSLRVEQGDAIEGSHYLEVEGRAPCISFSQDTLVMPVLGRSYTLTAWVRSPNFAYPRAELVIWEGVPLDNDIRDLKGHGTGFQIKGGDWQCVSVPMTVTHPDTTILRAELYLKGVDGERYQVDDMRMVEGETNPCPVTQLQLYNSSFEERTDITPWGMGGACQAEVRHDGTIAQDGAAFAVVTGKDSNCESIYQTTELSVQPGEIYNVAMWVRSADGSARTVEPVLWARGTIVEKSPRYYTITGTQWQCVETTLQTQQSGNLELSADLYVHEPDDSELWVDNVNLRLGTFENRPAPPLQITGITLPYGTQAVYHSGATVPLAVEISNQGASDSSPTNVRYWVTQHPNAEPLNDTAMDDLGIPVLAPNATYSKEEDALFAPVDLTPGPYYVVAEVVLSGHRYTLPEPVTIEACDEVGYFCDIPVEHWAYTGIEQWAAIPISSGCRSGTEPFVNRPFCPNLIVDNWAMAVFLLKYIKGPTFTPEEPATVYFVDTRADSRGRTALDYFYRQGVELRPTSCVSTVSEPKACPFQFVTRADMARYLAMVLEWNLDDPVTTDPPVDLPDDEFTRRAILYMDTQGYLDFAEPDCLPINGMRRFCPDLPLRRANASMIMSTVFSQ